MNSTILEILLPVAGAVFGTLVTLFVQSKRLPSDIRLTEANAEKEQHEAASMVIKNLVAEIERLKSKTTELESRLVKYEERATKAEIRAASAEERLADAEVREHKFRRDVIEIGERLDAERLKSRNMVVRLVGVVESLLDCIENPNRTNNIDRPAITRLIQSMLDGYSIGATQ